MASDRGCLEFTLEQLADLDDLPAPRDMPICCIAANAVLVRRSDEAAR